MSRQSSFLLVLGAAAILGCHHEIHGSESKGKLVVTSPLRRSTELNREYVAQIRAIQHIEVRALERGYLQGIFVDEGQLVNNGQRMFQIMPLIYQAEMQKAHAEADKSQIEYENTKTLADKNVVSPNELALAKADLNRAQAQMLLASTHRSLTEIKAPFTGIMGLFRVRQGSLVDEGDLLTTLSDNRTMWVYFNVAESEYLKLKAHSSEDKWAEVKLVMADGEIFDQPGKVETVEADFNNETGTIAFRAAFPNPKGLLRHGETGKILMTFPIKDALLIPQKATFEVLDKKFVFVVDDKNVVHSRPITLRAEMQGLYAVSDGLEERDKILVEGLRKVRDGSEVEPDYRKPAELLDHLAVPAE